MTSAVQDKMKHAVMSTKTVIKGSEPATSIMLESRTRSLSLGGFILTVLGFSFWFFVAVPFASHRETYTWLAMTRTQTFAEGFSLIPTTFRPLGHAATWLGFLILNPAIFPT